MNNQSSRTSDQMSLSGEIDRDMRMKRYATPELSSTVPGAEEETRNTRTPRATSWLGTSPQCAWLTGTVTTKMTHRRSSRRSVSKHVTFHWRHGMRIVPPRTPHPGERAKNQSSQAGCEAETCRRRSVQRAAARGVPQRARLRIDRRRRGSIDFLTERFHCGASSQRLGDADPPRNWPNLVSGNAGRQWPEFLAARLASGRCEDQIGRLLR